MRIHAAQPVHSPGVFELQIREFLGYCGTIYHFLPLLTPIVDPTTPSVNDWKEKCL
ncbi:MAG: hypothetical protein ACPL7O_07020 [Armatimonadota bacterium]